MRILLSLVLFGASLAACASPQKIRRGALEHERKAQRLEAQGRYEEAAREREAAQKQYRKAAERDRYYYYYYY
jgi:hypothetical protein